MRKEDFIAKYSDSKISIIITDFDSDEFIRVKHILDYIGIKYYVNINFGYINFTTEKFDLTNYSRILCSTFINEWELIDGKKYEQIRDNINLILQMNDINEKIKLIIRYDNFIGSDWINYKTSFKYSIYWNDVDDDIIIRLKGNGTFKIKL